MKGRLTLGGMTMLTGAILIGQLHALENPKGRSVNASPISTLRVKPLKSNAPVSELDKNQGLIGPDIIVSRLDSIDKFGTVGSLTGYASSTTSCNLGDVEAEWVNNGISNKHPLIAQNMYRYLNGRMEQIGMSWLKHAFFALDEFDVANCAECQPNGNGNALAIGCSDTYFASLNGAQARLGPRSEVNAATGVYPYPYELNWNLNGDFIYKRLQVANQDLDPVPNAGARYFLEAYYLTTDEQAWGNQYNNTSYRECFVGTFTGGGYNLNYGAPLTQPQMTAMHAWQDIDAGLTLVEVDVPGDGKIIVGYKNTDNGDGTWHYEYGVYNMNSDLSVRSVSLAAPSCLMVTNTGFHDVDYHSGEPYSGTDWAAEIAGDLLTWSSGTFATDPNANALRWNTMYNFHFDADASPGIGSLELGLFKPGDISSVQVPIMIPDPTACAADIASGDNVINVTDLLFMLAEWSNPASPADISGLGVCPDGTVNIFDLLALLAAWGPCP